MSSFTAWLARFCAREDGPTAVEYAVMLALVVVVCAVAIHQVGSDSRRTFRDVRRALQHRVPH